MQNIVEGEQKCWRSLCTFHFTQVQIDAQRASQKSDDVMTWRHVYFELKKRHGTRETFADMIHICCYCKALFWKQLGHACVSRAAEAPSVRVTPRQFVDMLMFL